jgi:hypothetical protein
MLRENYFEFSQNSENPHIIFARKLPSECPECPSKKVPEAPEVPLYAP